MAEQFTVKGINGHSTMNRSAYEDYQQLLKRRRDLGRYTLEEAAMALSEVTGERAAQMLKKLMNAVRDGVLPVYEPGKDARYTHGNNFASRVREFYEEAYWNDLNEWLEKNEPRLDFKFQNPADMPAAAKVGTNKKVWDDARLRALWEESLLPGVTNTSLAEKYGVTRQRIGALLKTAKEKFSTRGTSSPATFSTGLVHKMKG